MFVFLLGACLGSFSNVVILRWPKNESLMGRSHCGSCRQLIPWYHNIPMFSYFILKGRCSNCQSTFSICYPVIEFVMACLFLAVYLTYGVSWTTVEYFILVFGLVTASVIDYEHFLLPDLITYSGIVIGLVGAALNPERAFVESLIGFAFGGGILWLVAYVYFVFTGREGLGGGDIKLLAWLGSLLGWKSIPFIILVSSIVGSLFGVGISLINKKTKSNNDNKLLQTMIPFGPFIALAALLYIFGLKSVGSWYIQLFFPELD